MQRKAEQGPSAFVFPGQGAQCAEMLVPFRNEPSFIGVMKDVSRHLGVALHAEEEIPARFLTTNIGSSLLTAAASVLALDQLRREHITPIAVAGYSVGQWVALYAAEVINREDLFAIIATRANLMDSAARAHGACGMLAVIGPPRTALAEICADAEKAGAVLQISNENAPGQFTLSGNAMGLDFAEQRLPLLKPRRVKRLAVAGAWHSRIMNAAADNFAEVLAGKKLAKAVIPVIDNTTGKWMDALPSSQVLASQISAPVLWMQGVRTMIEFGAVSFLEVGYGDLLSKFGFFIDRTRRFVPMAKPMRVGA